MRNFVLMTLVQITCLFNFHLLAYLTNMFEQVYVTGIMSVSSEFVAYLIAGYVLERLGAKVSLMTCYTIAGIGGILMLSYGLDHTDSIAFPIIFLVCRFGVAGVYILFIAANARIFDVEKSATAFGLGSFFARMILSGAPLVSTMSQPLPMYIFTVTTIIAIGISYFIKVHPQAESRLKKSAKVQAEKPSATAANQEEEVQN